MRAIDSSAHEALKKTKRTLPTLAVIDLMLKDSNGLDLAKDSHMRYPGMQSLTVSSRGDARNRGPHALEPTTVDRHHATLWVEQNSQIPSDRRPRRPT